MQVEELQACLTTLVKAWAQAHLWQILGVSAITEVFDPEIGLL